MSTRLVHLVIDANDPAKLARFWAGALGWEIEDEGSGEVDVSPAGYHYPDPVALSLVFVPVPEPKTVKDRIHLDLASRTAEHQAEVVARLRDLGATPIDVGQGDDVPWVVLADPEGNELCVLEPRPAYMDTGPVAAVVVDSPDPGAAARFWQRAAGWEPASEWTDRFAALRAPQGVGPYLEFLRVPEPKTVKDRIHLDVAPFADGDRPAEAASLVEAGAVSVDVGQGDVTWTVLADPQGNEFCVLSPR
jgi:catechol 2,3-dioxygenase-like lactoylglutathione lyase family enzyme